MTPTDDLERLCSFNPDDYMTQAECAREALAELSEVLSLRGMARRNAASKFLSEYEATLRSALSSADEIARLCAENEALREALGPFAHAAFEAEGYPDCEAFTLVLRPDDEDGLREQDDEPESLITAGQLRRARQALQKGSRHE